MKSNSRFFLGANSKHGFVSYFDKLQEQNSSLELIILKGGPGSGKSSLMKRVSLAAEQKGHEIEYIPCASDPNSLDGFIDKTIEFAMIDGTSPHVEDPHYPGAASRIINLGDNWKADSLKENKLDIICLNKKIEQCHKSATAYIKSASALLDENRRVSAPYMKKTDIYTLAAKFAAMIPIGFDGIEQTRLLSAVSVGEVRFFNDTLKCYADKIYCIDDPWGSASDYFMKAIRDAAIGRDADIISCPCSISPEKTEHIIIPGERVAFVTSNLIHPAQKNAISIINNAYDDFDKTDLEKRLSDAARLLSDASKFIEKAKKLHDELEAFYVSAMDFSLTDKTCEDIITRYYK